MAASPAQTPRPAAEDEPDERLVERAVAGDAAAFRALIERHYDRTFRVLLSVLADAVEAEDAVQELWTRLPGKLAGWRGGARFTTWLHTVTLNAGRDALRRAGARARAHGGFAEWEALSRGAAEDVAARRRWLEEALERLTPELRETAALILGDAMSHADAAALLGVAESTVSWRMSAIRKRLKADAASEREESR